MISDQKAEQIISIRDTISIIENSIKEKQQEFEESVRAEKESLIHLNEEKIKLEKQFIDELKKENLSSFRTDNASFVHSRRNTVKILDEKELKEYIFENASELKNYVKDIFKTKEELLDNIAPRKISSSSVEILSDRFKDITGETLPGMEVVETNYLTIKKNKE